MKTWKVALLGLGTVGSGVVTILRTHAERIHKQANVSFDIVGILVRQLDKPRQVEVDRSLLTTDIAEIWEKEPEIVIDAMGGLDPALHYIEEAFARECHVISANKEMIATYGPRLHQLAQEKGVSFLYEASVGGGIPILNTLSQLLNANRITRVYGILNGTTNYILSKMEDEGLPYETVLGQAQELGFAEADPTADVEGYDAFSKIKIIANLCFGSEVKVATSEREGITSVTSEEISLYHKLGYRIKLLASAEKGTEGARLRVGPTLVPLDHPLAGVKNENNGVFVTGDVVGDLFFAGKGAGALPTGSAIVEDMLHVTRGNTFVLDPEPYQAETNEAGEEKALAAFFTLSKQVGDQPNIRLLAFLSSEAGVLHAVESVETKENIYVAAILSDTDVHVLEAFAGHLQAQVRVRPVLDERLVVSRKFEATLS
jgi:homoserine dehydrogenase